MALFGPIWESDLFLPSLPTPSSNHPPRPPFLTLQNLSLRSATNTPIGLDDFSLSFGVNFPEHSQPFWRGVVELNARAYGWVRSEALDRVGGQEAKKSVWRHGLVVRVIVQGKWRMSTFDDNYARDLRLEEGTDAVVMHTREHKRYHVLSMEAECYARSRVTLERGLLVNFVVMCGTKWAHEQTIRFLVDKYKQLYKKSHTDEAFFTADIYHTLVAHSSWLKDHWTNERWRNAEYAKRVQIPREDWETFWRAGKEARARAQGQGRTWGVKRKLGEEKKRKRGASPGGSGKRRKVENGQRRPGFARPPRSGQSSTATPPRSTRSRRTVEEIDLSGDVITRTCVVPPRSLQRRRNPRRQNETVDLDLTLPDSDDEVESLPSPQSANRPTQDDEMEVDQLDEAYDSSKASGPDLGGLFTPPPGNSDTEMRPVFPELASPRRPRKTAGRWNTQAASIMPFFPKELPVPEQANLLPAYFTHKPVLSPSYTWTCPCPSCIYTMDFLRPSPSFLATLRPDQVQMALSVHSGYTSAKLNGIFYVKVKEHFLEHVKEMGMGRWGRPKMDDGEM
ncbi:hypothetical protein DACRYDRAFT_107716 [Dacryopinax primogenitus]|uniref:Uncharacterized protein n=1 Tax=Dacryopinax primogenitus (strain DJM 731) TaxID=1858805 RepID=M5GCV4_DACPD|nr:uncharacterized protein DACRYDRAFT_107716 [Dacryopinax primogenitus]EJU01993.1 hypothetical protein DACRYDRAFT_107716 [Dacryopinax primogenitus]